MSNAERDVLAGILAVQANRMRRWKEGVANAFVALATSLLAFVLVWAAVAWLIRRAIGLDYGWQSPAAMWIVMFGALLCAVCAVTSTVRWVRSWPDDRAGLRTDLDGGVVIDESYRFVDVKRFQEPEHGGLMYFFRTEDDRVLVLYDHESSNLGCAGEDPLSSSFRPTAEPTMARAPATSLVLDKRFDGSALELSAPIELAVQPAHWPDQDKLCTISWNDLEGRLGRKASRSA